MSGSAGYTEPVGRIAYSFVPGHASSGRETLIIAMSQLIRNDFSSRWTRRRWVQDSPDTTKPLGVATCGDCGPRATAGGPKSGWYGFGSMRIPRGRDRQCAVFFIFLMPPDTRHVRISGAAYRDRRVASFCCSVWINKSGAS